MMCVVQMCRGIGLRGDACLVDAEMIEDLEKDYLSKQAFVDTSILLVSDDIVSAVKLLQPSLRRKHLLVSSDNITEKVKSFVIKKYGKFRPNFVGAISAFVDQVSIVLILEAKNLLPA